MPGPVSLLQSPATSEPPAIQSPSGARSLRRLHSALQASRAELPTANATPVCPQEPTEMSTNDGDDLRSMARATLLKASRDGRLQAALGARQAAVAAADVDEVRRQIRTTLACAARNGTLKEALYKLAPQEEASEEGMDKPLHFLRASALKTLIDGSEDGRLAAALQTTRETAKKAAPVRLLSAMKGSKAKARAEAASQAAAEALSDEASSEEEPDKLEHLRQVVRDSLTRACRDGRLEAALQVRRPTAPRSPSEVENLRDLARATLMKAGMDGRLKDALLAMRPSVASTQAGPSEEGSDNEEDIDDEYDIDALRMKSPTSSSMLSTASTPAMSETNSPSSSSSPAVYSLRSSLLSTLVNAAQSGKLQDTLHERNQALAREPSVDEVRDTAQRSLIAACRDGRLEEALKETLSRTPMPQTAQTLRLQPDAESLELVRRKAELASSTEADMDQLRAVARSALAKALGVRLLADEGGSDSPRAPPPSETDFDLGSSNLDKEDLLQRLGALAKEAHVEQEAQDDTGSEAEISAACRNARVALSRVFGLEAGSKNKDSEEQRSKLAQEEDQVVDMDSLCLKAQGALVAAFGISEEEDVCATAREALCKALGVGDETEEDGLRDLRHTAQVALENALGVDDASSEVEADMRDLCLTAQNALEQALDIEKEQADFQAEMQQLKATAQDALCKALGVEVQEDASPELQKMAQMALCKALGLQTDAREQEEEVDLRQFAKAALCKALDVQNDSITEDAENLRTSVRNTLVAASRDGRLQAALTRTNAKQQEDPLPSGDELRENVRRVLVNASNDGRLADALFKVKERFAAKQVAEQEATVTPSLEEALAQARNVFLSVPEDRAAATPPRSPVKNKAQPLSLFYQADQMESSKTPAPAAAALPSPPSRSSRKRMVIADAPRKSPSGSASGLLNRSEALAALRPLSPSAMQQPLPPLSPSGPKLSPTKLSSFSARLGTSASTPALSADYFAGLSSSGAGGKALTAMEEDLGLPCKDSSGKATGLTGQRATSLGSLKITKKPSAGLLPGLPATKASAGSIAWTMNRSRNKWDGTLGAGLVAGWAV